MQRSAQVEHPVTAQKFSEYFKPTRFPAYLAFEGDERFWLCLSKKPTTRKEFEEVVESLKHTSNPFIKNKDELIARLNLAIKIGIEETELKKEVKPTILHPHPVSKIEVPVENTAALPKNYWLEVNETELKSKKIQDAESYNELCEVEIDLDKEQLSDDEIDLDKEINWSSVENAEDVEDVDLDHFHQRIGPKIEINDTPASKENLQSTDLPKEKVSEKKPALWVNTQDSDEEPDAQIVDESLDVNKAQPVFSPRRSALQTFATFSFSTEFRNDENELGNDELLGARTSPEVSPTKS